MRCYRLFFKLIITALMLKLASYSSQALAVSDIDIKRVFLYQFVHFCSWPKEKFETPESPYRIGIVDTGEMLKSLDAQPDKKINNRNVLYEQLEFDFSEANLKRFHIIFIADSASNKMPSIVEATKLMSILTVSDSPKSDMPPTMIDFVKKDNKIRFRVDNERAEAVELKLKSQLLRLAVK